VAKQPHIHANSATAETLFQFLSVLLCQTTQDIINHFCQRPIVNPMAIHPPVEGGSLHQNLLVDAYGRQGVNPEPAVLLGAPVT
jgi:hypothetical protein